jgi:hypothetical protein
MILIEGKVIRREIDPSEDKAIRRVAARMNDTADTNVNSGLVDDERPCRVDVHNDFRRVIQRVRNSGKVNNDLRSSKSTTTGIDVKNTPLNKRNIERLRGNPIKDRSLVAVIEKLRDNVAANVTRPTGNNDAHEKDPFSKAIPLYFLTTTAVPFIFSA